MWFKLLLLLAVLAPPAWGDDQFLTLSVENDMFASNKDSNYTHGTRLSYLNTQEDVPEIAQWVADKVPFFEGDLLKGYTVSLGQNMYTPKDITQAGSQAGDRPWAGYTYLALGMASAEADLSVIDELEMSVGVVGPASLADETQGWVHRVVGANEPRGWGNQLHNEPALNLAWQRRWPQSWTHPLGPTLLSFTPHTTVVAGNVYTHAGTGGMLRWSSNPSALIDNPVRVRPSMPGTGFFEAVTEPSLILFAGAEERLVARNIFLDGNTFDGESPEVRKRNLVTDLQVGAVATWKRYQLGYTAVYRTKEFFGQDDAQVFGAITLGYRF